MDVLDLWQSQRGEGFQMTPDDIRQRAERMEKKLQLRTRGGYVVCASLIVFLSFWAIVSNNSLQRLGAVLTIGALVYMARQLRQNAMKKPAASTMGETPSVDYLRTELARQRDFHRGRTFWSRLLLLITSGLLFFLGFAIAHPEVARMIRYETIAFVILGIAAIPLNLWMARKYQQQIDELDRMQKEPS
jgi:NhaP-type Na+/H+ or K+/H+ antiporter